MAIKIENTRLWLMGKKSSENGYAFECACINLLLKLNNSKLDTESQRLFDRKHESANRFLPNFNKDILLSILPGLDYKIQLLKDNSECCGDVLIKYTDGHKISLSLKSLTSRNNPLGLSLKHPRARPLFSHVNNSRIAANYYQQYDRLNSKWYQTVKCYQKFSELPTKIKMELYSQFTDLAQNCLIACSNSNLLELVNFCIDNNNCGGSKKYLITLNKGNILKRFSMHNFAVDNISIFKVSETTLVIYFDTEHSCGLKFRLHNARGDITKNLSLKYDVTALNFNKLYQLHQTCNNRIKISIKHRVNNQ